MSKTPFILAAVPAMTDPGKRLDVKLFNYYESIASDLPLVFLCFYPTYYSFVKGYFVFTLVLTYDTDCVKQKLVISSRRN